MFVAIGISIVICIIIPEYEDNLYIIELKEKCGYIFNPATTLSNYTSYKHCLEFPETYGVNK